MPKKRAVIVDHHRDKRLQLAAALKGPELSIVMLESENELFADTQQADLFVLRAEMDRSSGYSMCNRLRSNDKTSRAKIVIVAADTKDPRLTQHKTSPQAADTYISPPLGLKDLRLQAYSLLDLDGGTVADDDIQAVEDDPFSAIDRALTEQAPGTKPAANDTPQEAVKPVIDDKPKPDFSDADFEGAFGALDPSSKPKPKEEPTPKLEEPEVIEEADVMEVKEIANVPSPLSQLSEDELKFVADAFQRVKNTPNAPPLPPGIKSAKDLRGPEAKIFMLREKLREREVEIARLHEIWQQHEHEYKTSAQRLHEMEIEVKAAQMAADEARSKLQERDQEIKREQKGSSVAIDKLLEDKFVLEKDLIEVVASKEKTLAEHKRTISARERDIEALQAEKARLEQELVDTRARDDAALQQARVEGDIALNQARTEGEAALALAREHAAAQLADLKQQAEQALAAANQRAEDEKRALQDEMAQKLEAAAKLQAETEQTAATRLADTERMAAEKLAETERLAAEKLAETERVAAEKQKQLEEQKATLEQESNETLKQLETKLAEYEDRMAEQATQLATLREDVARKEKNEIEQASHLGELKAKLAATEQSSGEKVAQSQKELEAAKKEREEQQQRLVARIQERETMLTQKDGVVEQLSKELQVAREEKESLTKKLSERLAEREKTIESLTDRAEALQIEKIQLEERVKAMVEERARIDRLLNDGDPEPAKTEAPAGSADQEESIPIADSNESALLGDSKKAV